MRLTLLASLRTETMDKILLVMSGSIGMMMTSHEISPNRFIYRYGYTDAGRHVIAQKTGVNHNPFAQQQQQTNERPFFDI